MTDDPRYFALQAALRRQRVHLELAVADNDAAIAAWDAIDDRRIDDESLPDRAATDLDAPASPLPLPPWRRPVRNDVADRTQDRRIDAEVEVTAYGDAEHWWQNTETGERRRGSPISAKPGDDEASHA